MERHKSEQHTEGLEAGKSNLEMRITEIQIPEPQKLRSTLCEGKRINIVLEAKGEMK